MIFGCPWEQETSLFYGIMGSCNILIYGFGELFSVSALDIPHCILRFIGESSLMNSFIGKFIMSENECEYAI